MLAMDPSIKIIDMVKAYVNSLTKLENKWKICSDLTLVLSLIQPTANA